MLYTTLLKIKEKNNNVLPEDVKKKVDVFYALGRLTDKEYNDLMDVNVPGEEVENTEE